MIPRLTREPGIEDSNSGPIYQECSRRFEEVSQYLIYIWGEHGFVQSHRHQLDPTVARCCPDRERSVPDTQPRMTALFDVPGWSTKPENEKVSQALLRARKIVFLVERCQDAILRHLSIKCGDQSLESVIADHGINFVLFHSNYVKKRDRLPDRLHPNMDRPTCLLFQQAPRVMLAGRS